MDTFIEWLQTELKTRDWTQADLARRSRVSQTHLSRIMNNMRKPGPDALVNIARALRISPEEIFRQAGIIPRTNANAKPREERQMTDLIRKIEALPPDDQRLIFDLVERIERSNEG